MKIIRALNQSIETGKPVQIQHLEQHQRPTSAQNINRPPVEEKPELVNAASPAG